jgi:hypothetical protein
MVIDVCFTQMSAMSWWLICVSPKCQLCHSDWCVFHPNVSYVMEIDVCFTSRSVMSWWLFPFLQCQLCHGNYVCFTPTSAMSWWLMCISLQWLVIVFGLLQCQRCHSDCGWFTPMLAVLMVNCVWFTPMLAMPWWLIVFGLLQCQLCHSWLWLVYSSAISAMMAVLLQC